MTDSRPDTDDRTLDELRLALAPLVARHAAFDGWTPAALAAAAAEIGIPAGRAALAFPGGAIDMIDAWFVHLDAAMVAALPPERIAGMKVRARITALLTARLDAAAPDREALRRALTILLLPQNMARATRLGWRAADRMWRLAGDTSADISHYTRRTTLLGVYSATLLVFIDDESEGFADTRAFLGRRIDEVIRFETFKSRLGKDPDMRLSPARFFGRLRYRAR